MTDLISRTFHLRAIARRDTRPVTHTHTPGIFLPRPPWTLDEQAYVMARKKFELKGEIDVTSVYHVMSLGCLVLSSAAMLPTHAVHDPCLYGVSGEADLRLRNSWCS